MFCRLPAHTASCTKALQLLEFAGRVPARFEETCRGYKAGWGSLCRLLVQDKEALVVPQPLRATGRGPTRPSGTYPKVLQCLRMLGGAYQDQSDMLRLHSWMVLQCRLSAYDTQCTLGTQGCWAGPNQIRSSVLRLQGWIMFAVQVLACDVEHMWFPGILLFFNVTHLS